MSKFGPYVESVKDAATTVTSTLNKHRGKVVAATAATYTILDVVTQETFPPYIRLPLIGLFGTIMSLPISGGVLGDSHLAEKQLTKNKKRSIDVADLKEVEALQEDIVAKVNDDVAEEDRVEEVNPAANPVVLEANPSFTPSADNSAKRRKVKDIDEAAEENAAEAAPEVEPVVVAPKVVKGRKIVRAKRTPKK